MDSKSSRLIVSPSLLYSGGVDASSDGSESRNIRSNQAKVYLYITMSDSFSILIELCLVCCCSRCKILYILLIMFLMLL